MCTHGRLMFDIEFMDGAGYSIVPNCGTRPSFLLGHVTTTETGYESTNCGSCECESPTPEGAREVQLTSVSPIAFEGCGRLVVWDDFVGGECVHAGVAVVPGNELLPHGVASKALSLPRGVFPFVGEIDLVDREPCPTQRCETAGIKALKFPDRTVVDVGWTGDVELSGLEAHYEVFNYKSEVTAACTPEVIWTAERAD